MNTKESLQEELEARRVDLAEMLEIRDNIMLDIHYLKGAIWHFDAFPRSRALLREAVRNGTVIDQNGNARFLDDMGCARQYCSNCEVAFSYSGGCPSCGMRGNILHKRNYDRTGQPRDEDGLLIFAIGDIVQIGKHFGMLNPPLLPPLEGRIRANPYAPPMTFEGNVAEVIGFYGPKVLIRFMLKPERVWMSCKMHRNNLRFVV